MPRQASRGAAAPLPCWGESCSLALLWTAALPAAAALLSGCSCRSLGAARWMVVGIAGIGGSSCWPLLSAAHGSRKNPDGGSCS